VNRPMRIYIRSFGCPTNFADGEFMAGCLAEAGYEIVQSVKEADILIYNTCAVKTPTENRMIKILKRAPKTKRLIVTGCLPLINLRRLKAEVEVDGILGPSPGPRIVEAVRRVALGDKVLMLEGNSKPGLNLPRVPLNPVVSIIPISYGCLGACTYCCVRFARGRLRSYRIEEIVERVRRDLASGASEVWLTSQDSACYGRDISTNLVELLREVCRIEGRFFVRVGMMTPNHALEMLDGLIQAYKNGKVFKFLHIPVQSGDDEVLRRMNRLYTVREFKRIVHAFRREIPQITIATDIICGFPGESPEAFQRTLHLLEEVKPDVVNISKFFPRPGTPAERLNPKVPPGEIKRRSRRATELARRISLERNRRWIGWEGVVLVDEVGTRPGTWISRNFAYKPIVVRSEGPMLGKFLEVRVVDAHPTHLEAEILRQLD